MAQNLAKEYTPELGAEYLAGELADVSDIYRAEEGRATAEAGARGLLGQFQGDAMVGQTRTARSRGLSDTIRQFNLQKAGLQREERLIGEGRDFQSAEAQKSRDFEEGLAVKLANMGYKYGDASARRDMIYGQQGAVMGAGIQFGSEIGKGLIMSAFSDRRLKRDIKPTGEVSGGLPIYEYEYRTDEFPTLKLPTGVHRGFMADEVERVMPEAVVMLNGFKSVHYDMLGGRP